MDRLWDVVAVVLLFVVFGLFVSGGFVDGDDIPTGFFVKKAVRKAVVQVRAPAGPVQNAPAVADNARGIVQAGRGVQGGVQQAAAPRQVVSVGARCRSSDECGDLVCEKPGGIPQGSCKVRVGRQCLATADCTMGHECVNRVCALPPPPQVGEGRVIYPSFVHVNSVIDRQDPNTRGVAASDFFRFTNMRPTMFRQPDDANTVFALPYDGVLNQKIGGGWCREFSGVAAPAPFNSAQWCSIQHQGESLIFNRFAAFRFNYGETGRGRTTTGVLEIRKLQGGPRGKAVGVFVFGYNGASLRRLGYCALGENEARKQCSFLLDGTRPDEIVIARSKYTSAVVPYVHDLHIEYETEVPTVPLHEQDGVLVLNNVGGKWVPGQTLGDMLGDDEVVVIAVPGPDGKKRNFAISRQDMACVSDQGEAKRMKDWAQGQRQDVVAGVLEKVGDALGKDFAGMAGNLISGTADERLQRDLQNIKMCDDSDRCKMMKDNGLITSDGTPEGYEQRGNRLGGDERAMAGGAQDRFQSQMRGYVTGDRSYGEPSVRSFFVRVSGAGDVVNPGDIVKFELTSFPNGASQITSTPYELVRLQAGTQSTPSFQPDAHSSPTTNHLDPNNQDDMGSLNQLNSLANQDKDTITPTSNVNPNDKAPDSIDVVKMNAPEDPDNPAANCPPDEDRCYQLSEEAKQMLQELAPDVYFAIMADGRITPSEVRERHEEWVSNRRPDQDMPPGQRVPQTPEEQCLFQHSERVPEINPGNMGDIYPNHCNFNCPPQQLAVGLSCEEESEEQQLPSPMATCATNLMDRPRNRNAIDCPQDNPNCGRGAAGGGQGGGAGGGGSEGGGRY